MTFLLTNLRYLTVVESVHYTLLIESVTAFHPGVRAVRPHHTVGGKSRSHYKGQCGMGDIMPIFGRYNLLSVLIQAFSKTMLYHPSDSFTDFSCCITGTTAVIQVLTGSRETKANIISSI